MITSFTRVAFRVWQYASNPDTDVHNEEEVRAEAHDLFINTSNNALFFCVDGTLNAQVWKRLAYTS